MVGESIRRSMLREENHEEVEGPVEGTDGPAIPTNLREKFQEGSIQYKGEEVWSLQNLARAYGIPEDQGPEDLLDALEDVRGGQ